MRYKLLSAASAIAMAMAIGGAQAAELLVDEQLDTVVAGAVALGASTGANAGSAVAGGTCGTCFAGSATNQVNLANSGLAAGIELH